jgi:FkbM family methyltransferase
MSAVHQLYLRYVRGPDHPMKGRIVSHIERAIFPERGIALGTDDGTQMWVHPRAYAERHILHTGTYQRNCLRFTRANLKHGDVVAVAGVSLGHQLIAAAQMVGPEGTALGVDPHPAALMRSRENVVLNKLGNVRLVAAALGDKDSILPLTGHMPDVRGASFTHALDETPFYVSVTTLPALLEKLDVVRLDALFLDVIGYEPQVLRALSGSTYRPRLITVAVHPIVCKNTGVTFANFRCLLTEMGYALWTMDGQSANDASDLLECQLVAAKVDDVPVWLKYDPTVPRGVWSPP